MLVAVVPYISFLFRGIAFFFQVPFRLGLDLSFASGDFFNFDLPTRTIVFALLLGFL
jgi:hypothetical protein